MEGDCSFSFFYVLFLSVKEKEPSESSGTRLGWPAAFARQRNAHPPQKIFCGAFLSEKPRREKTGTVSRERAARWGTLISHPVKVSFLWFFLFFSRKKRKNTPPMPPRAKPRCGPRAGLRSSPSPIRFLFFGSFFSFPERKERTEKKGRTEKESAVKSQARAGWRGPVRYALFTR